jgi:hypothetical protein
LDFNIISRPSSRIHPRSWRSVSPLRAKFFDIVKISHNVLSRKGGITSSAEEDKKKREKKKGKSGGDALRHKKPRQAA